MTVVQLKPLIGVLSLDAGLDCAMKGMAIEGT